MDNLKAYYANRFERDDSVLGVIAAKGPSETSPLIEGFDLLLLVVSDNPNDDTILMSTYHYIKDGCRIQERWTDRSGLQRWIAQGENRSIIHWILQGEIWLDRNGYMTDVKKQLSEFSASMRERKLFMEFSRFLHVYLESKQYLQDGDVLDAYSHILEALRHWAAVVIIESGAHPEVTVWRQVRKINPGVYKLYEELTQSTETMEQRVQLVHLACEFSIMSKMQNCCGILMRILESRKEPWSAEQLKEHPNLSNLPVELGLILKKLVKKSLIREVAVVHDNDLNLLELQYTS